MAQFDLYAGVGRANGYVVDVQADLLDRLATRIVAPLMPRDLAAVITGLNPVVEIQGAEFVILMQELAAVPVRELQSRAGTLGHYQDDIKRAMDLLFFGL